MQMVAEQMMTKPSVEVDGKKYPVKRTSTSHLKTVRFSIGDHEFTAIEQNAEKPSRWGKLARDGHKVVQFKDNRTNRFVAVAVDGKVKEYSGLKKLRK